MQPRQKYPIAQTSNQEVGWLVNPLVPRNSRQSFNRQKTAITGYMEEYVTLTRVNPFAVKNR